MHSGDVRSRKTAATVHSLLYRYSALQIPHAEMVRRTCAAAASKRGRRVVVVGGPPESVSALAC